MFMYAYIYCSMWRHGCMAHMRVYICTYITYWISLTYSKCMYVHIINFQYKQCPHLGCSGTPQQPTVPWVGNEMSNSDICNRQEVCVIIDYIYTINKFGLVWWFGRICMPTNIMCIPNIMTNYRIIARKYYEHQKIWNRFKMTIYMQINL